MIKLIASDMDGTLLDGKGILSKRVPSVIKELSVKEINFAVISGRFPSTLQLNFKLIKEDIILVGHNGAFIFYKESGKIISKKLISSLLVGNIVNKLKKNEVDTYVCGRNCAYLEKGCSILEEYFIKSGIEYKIVKDVSKIDDAIYKIGGFYMNGVREKDINFVDSICNAELNYEISGDTWIDIMNKEVSKGNALNEIQNHISVRKDETMVFGDYYNDITMFQQAEYSYAMDHSPIEVKNNAKFIAGDNDENAVLNIIEELCI